MKEMSNLQQATKIVGWLWIAFGVAMFGYAAFFLYSDYRSSGSEDPTGFGFVFGVLHASVSLLAALCGIALVRSWHGKVLWLSVPALLLVLHARWFMGGLAA
jgi:hypothetical protein